MELHPKMIQKDHQPKPISLAEFKSRKIHSPLPYRDGDQITRDNLASWFVRSFSISRGAPDVQYGHARWSAAQTGLDLTATFENFLAAGAGDCLSKTEIELMQNAYDRVKIHKTEDEKIAKQGGTPTSLMMRLEYFATEAVFGHEYQRFILKDFQDLSQFDNLSRQEFMSWADKQYQTTLAIRADRERRAKETEE